jgi:hypothetical protein
MQPVNSLSVQICAPWMKPRRWRQSLLHLRRALPLAGFTREQLLLHAGRAETILNCFDDGRICKLLAKAR